MASDQERLKQGILDLRQALADVAQARQTIVVSSIILRRNGEVYEPSQAGQFETARASTVKAAYSLDTVLDQIRQDNEADWVKIIGEFNKYAQNIPGVNISSTSIGEVIELCIPPIPQAILVPQDSEKARSELRAEMEFYAIKPEKSMNGLGLLPAVLLPLTSACGAAMAAVAGPTLGIGSIVVAAGCGLAALAIVVGTVVLVSKAIKGVVDIFNPNAAVAREEAARLKSLQSVYAELEKSSAGMTAEQKLKLFKDAGATGIKQPTSENFTLMLALGVAAFAIFAIYVLPKMGSKSKSKPIREATPAVAGLRGRKRRHFLSSHRRR